jgi:hypothetical protein
MLRFELWIDLNGIKYALDTYKSEPISLTYNIADVNDIASRNTSYSKTIRLPETRNNRNIFGDIADLGVSPAYFNPNKKTKAWILVDSAVVFEGYLQLRKVYIDKETEQADYEVVIYADNDNFYKQLADDFISDDDYSELNHSWTKTNVIQSWTASWNNGYYYPLIDYGQDWDLGEITGWTSSWNCKVQVKDIYPATNVKYIFDKIFSNAGYNYTSNFLNGDVFKNLYIPFNKTSFTREGLTSSAGRFTVGFTQSFTYYNGVVKNTSRTMLTAGPHGAVSTPNAHAVSLGSYHIPFNYEGAPYGDPDGLYLWDNYSPNNSTYWYSAPVDFIAEQFVCNFDIRFPYGIDYNGYNLGTTDYLAHISFRRSRDPFTGITASSGVVVPIGGSTDFRRFIAADIPGITYNETGGGYTPIGGKRVIGQIATDMLSGTTASNTRKLYAGEKLWVEVAYSVPANSLRAQGGMIDGTTPSGGSTIPVWTMPVSSGGTYPLITFNSNSQFFNSLSQTISPNETIPYNSVLPKNIKKKDFINSIIKMFNLYVEPSKDYPNTLKIEPRDDYYQGGTIKDWTRKLNTNTAVEEQILGETQNKKTIFKYKDDKDFYNTDYTTTTGGITYGEYNYYIDNDFTTGEKKIELIFSPTPIVAVRVPNSTNYSKIIIPKIVKNQQDQSQPFTDSNIRILTRRYNYTKSPWVYGDFQFNTTSGPYNAYIKLTSSGFGNATHNFSVGDYIKVAQVDAGALKPMLQSNFKIVEIVDNKTIVIDIPFSYVGSGTATGGTCYPLDGLVGIPENNTWCFEDSYFRAYPYLGHLNDPQYPIYDLNFGQTLGLYYPQTLITNNNLYNIYWENFINELSDRDSRIITAEFYLTPFDIADFKFNDNIFIKDQYFKVNKIINYDPTTESLVKIELIKSQFITVPRTITRTTGSGVGVGISIGLANVGLSSTVGLRGPLISGGSITTAGNTPTSAGAMLVGRDNIGGGLVVGRNNIQSSQNSMVVGNNNSVDSNSNGSFIAGDNNDIIAGITAKPKYVLGSNNIHSGSGLVIGDANNIQVGAQNTYLFGSNNTVQATTANVDSATYSFGSAATNRVFIFGDANIIGSSTFSFIQGVFIQGTGSTVKADNVSIFGDNVVVGTNSTGSHIIGDNVSINTPNTHLVSKEKMTVQGGTLAVISQSNFSGRATFSSTTAMTGAFLTTGTVSMTGNTNIANLTQTTNLNQVFV